MITIKHELTNTSDRHLLVGNYHEIISAHRTADAAHDALAEIGHDGPDGLAETKWAVVHVLAPGMSISGSLVAPLPSDEQDEAEAVASNKALMAEMFGSDQQRDQIEEATELSMKSRYLIEKAFLPICMVDNTGNWVQPILSGNTESGRPVYRKMEGRKPAFLGYDWTALFVECLTEDLGTEFFAIA